LAQVFLTQGKGELLADAWYDNNLILKAMFKAGYLPTVKPNKGRIGESIFGSLKNWLGDRVKTSLIASTITRIGARIYCLFSKNLH
jgi:hypothetical protein